MGIIDKIKAKKAYKKRLKSAPPLNKPEDPFYISKDGKELSKKEYYNMVGTNKYTETARDKYIYENSTQSMNKKKRKLKIRRDAK
jgi:hypothetical protein